MTYPPFQTTRQRRRRRIMWGLGVTALVLVVALVWASGVLGQRVAQDAPAPDVSRETSAPSEDSMPWPIPATPSQDPAPESSPLPGEVDRTDPDSVAEAFALMTVSWDTPEDTNETPAAERAREAFGAEELALSPAPVRAGAGWLGPSQQGSYTTATATVTPMDEHMTEHAVYVPTGERVRPVTVAVTYRWVGTDPATGDPWPEESREVLLSLVERDGEWEVIEYGYR